MLRLLLIGLWSIGLALLTACAPADPAPTPAPGETEQIRASDGETGIISVTYPAQWIAVEQADHSISLANSPQALRSYDIDMTELQPGHLAGTVSALKKDALPVDIENTPQGVLSYVVRTISQGGQVEYTFGTVDSVTLNGREAAVSEGFGTETGSDAALAIRVLVIDADEAYGILFFGAPFGELTPQYDTLAEIAGSFLFNPLPTPEPAG